MDLTFAPKSRLISAPIPNFCKISPLSFGCKLAPLHPLVSFTPSTPRGFACVRKGSMAWWEGIDEARVLIAPEPSKDGNKVGQLLSLQHPKSGNATCYVCVDGSLQELHWFKQSYGSWFLGDYVCEDGRLYTATPVDPVFVLLPIFEEARMKKNDDQGKFRQLDEITYVVGYPGYQHLSSVAENCMQVVCDVKDIGKTQFYRLNDEKVLKWLCFKVIQLKKTLLTLDKNYAARDKKEILTDAVSIIGEYLKDEPWLKLLCSKLWERATTGKRLVRVKDRLKRPKWRPTP
nr:ribonuclease H2 subunit B isoform X2 [Nicotiana tomentosiformis]